MKNQIAIYSLESGSFSLRDQQTEIAPSHHHVKIKIKWVGICGSDLHSMETKFLKELSLGHEWIGEVVETGPEVRNFKPGEFVTSTVMITCGVCEACMDGREDCEKKYSLAVNHGMLRNFAWLPEKSLVKVPLPADKNSTLFEILAVAENVHTKMSPVMNKGQKVLIFGAGLLGLSVALVFKKRGYEPLLLEIISSRIRRAESIGLSARHITGALMDKSLAESWEMMIDASGDHLGSKGAWQYLEHFGKNGFRAIMLAKYLQPMNLRTDRFFSKQAKLDWIQGCTKESLKEAIHQWKDELPELGPKLITHTFSLDEVNEAFAAAKDREQSGRVILSLDP